jgi:hypothetical protein
MMYECRARHEYREKVRPGTAREADLGQAGGRAMQEQLPRMSEAAIPVDKNGGPEEPPSADPKASAVVSSMNQRGDVNPLIGHRLYGKLRR